jgi:polyhydroxyalkanoate synthesis repressor PhaR
MTEPTQPAPASASSSPVVLKKYGNRRLYDTNASRYVTLVEVEAMVQQGTDIVVLDAKTGSDITKEVLVQLLLERDDARAALPVGLLKQAVKLAGTPLKENLARVMQEGLDAFLGSQRAVVDAQRVFSAQMAQMAQMTPPMAAPWAQAPTLWNPFAAMTPPPARADVAPANPPPAPLSQAQQATTTMTSVQAQQGHQLDALRAELGETQALVKKLLERELAAASAKEPKAPKESKAKATRAKAAKKPRAR